MPTGVPGMDVVLNGGLLRGAMYLVTGEPGTGKTVLSSQVAFQRAAAGENVVYVTSLSESHARLLSNLESFEFFDRSLIQSRITFLSAISTLEEGGLDKLQALVSQAVRTHHASLLVLDNLGSVSEVAPSPFAYRKCLRDIGAVLTLIGCTALLLAPQRPPQEGLEQFAADGIIDLSQQMSGMRQTRELRVRKFRGSPHLQGLHVFEISASGITLYPRREVLLLKRELATALPSGRSGFGIAGLDDMLKGGLVSSSMTALVGAPGSGKTLLGLNLLAEGLRAGQPCLYLGFNEMPPRLLSKAEGVGLGLAEYVRTGQLELLWRQPTEQLLDVIAEQLLEVVYRRKVRRLFLDGLDGLLQAATHLERFPSFLIALTNELRSLEVTSAISMAASFSGPEFGMAPQDLPASMDNLILVRYVELRARLHRLISILKVRESDYDPDLREFRITARGLEVASTSESAEAILGERSGRIPAPLSHARGRPTSADPPTSGGSGGGV